MADDNTQDTPPVSTLETEPSSEVKTTPEEQGDDQTQKTTVQAEQQSKQDQEVQERKPSRIEKRLRQVLEREKQARVPAYIPQQVPEGGDEKVIEVDEEALRQNIQQEVTKAIEEDRAVREYHTTTESHLQDIEAVEKQGVSKPVMDIATKQYHALNFQYDPITGRELFVPAVKFSDIVKDVQAKIELAAQEYAAGSRQYREEVSNTSAIPSTSAGSRGETVTPDTQDFKAFERTFGKR